MNEHIKDVYKVMSGNMTREVSKAHYTHNESLVFTAKTPLKLSHRANQPKKGRQKYYSTFSTSKHSDNWQKILVIRAGCDITEGWFPGICVLVKQGNNAKDELLSLTSLTD